MKKIIEIVVEGKDQTSAALSKVGGAVSGLGSVAAGVATGGLAIAAAAIVGLGVAAVGASVGVYKLTMAAADVEGTRQTFQRLGGDLDSLKESTRGMVNEADLMAASNKLMAMGIGETTEEVADLSEMATQLGLAMNEDATASMENFALMMANQSIPRLDSFGISSAAVRERIKELMATTEASGISQGDWDKKVGKSTVRLEELKGKLHLAGLKQAEWTEKTKESTKVAHAQRIDKITRQIAEEEVALSNLMATTVGITEASVAMNREEAFKIAVLEEGRIAMKKVGEQGESATATTLRWKAVIADLGLGIGQAFIPALEAIRKPVLDLVDKYGPKVVEWANIAGEWLGEKLPVAIRTLETLWTRYWPEAGENLVNFWNTIKPGLIWVRDMFQAFTTTFLPQLESAWNILKAGWEEISATYQTELKPALEQLWEALGIGKTSSEGVGGAMGSFAGILSNLAASGVIIYIKLALEGFIFAMEAGKATGEALVGAIDKISRAIEWANHWVNTIKGALNSAYDAFNRVRDAIDRVKRMFEEFKQAIAGFELPWWLTPGSPTPLETGLLGIGKALSGVQGLAGGGLFIGAGGGGGDITRSVENNLTMNVQTRATTGQVVMGFETMAALV